MLTRTGHHEASETYLNARRLYIDVSTSTWYLLLTVRLLRREIQLGPPLASSFFFVWIYAPRRRYLQPGAFIFRFQLRRDAPHHHHHPTKVSFFDLAPHLSGGAIPACQYFASHSLIRPLNHPLSEVSLNMGYQSPKTLICPFADNYIRPILSLYNESHRIQVSVIAGAAVQSTESPCAGPYHAPLRRVDGRASFLVFSTGKV